MSVEISIIDIRQDDLRHSLVKEIHSSLNPHDGQVRALPTTLLYDAEGLRTFEDITYVDEYYLTNAEIEVLHTHAKAIAEKMAENAQLVELGSGCVPPNTGRQ
jgi:L-histidine Nalpha-methyltransferase / hercynylcysteine S-oxide synthase